MTGFGEELREERTRQNLTLETVSAQTKVNPRYLDAIERNDLLALPGGVFRKGIVRAYLAALGLEEDAWMTRYQTTWDGLAQSSAVTSENAKRAEQDAWTTFAINVQRGRGRPKENHMVRWLGVLVLFLMLAAAAWFVLRHLHSASLRSETPSAKIARDAANIHYASQRAGTSGAARLRPHRFKDSLSGT